VGDPSEGGTAGGTAGIQVDAERWVGALRRAVEAQRRIFRDHVGIGTRTRYDGVGEGGDRALVIDRLCEDAVFAELEALHAEGLEFSVVSEERGEVSFGAPESRLKVVIDPIDGSLNARRMIPCHSLSVAIAEGETMADVTLGYVYEFGAGEEFVAVRGEGVELNGAPVSVPPGDGLEVVAMEATRPERILPVAEALAGKVFRLRTSGSIAVSLAYVAAARYDGMISTRVCRSVDAAAAQLMVREAGGALAFDAGELADAALDLGVRYQVAAARTTGDLGTLLGAQATLS
jgi:myo-inositol-1(or 4)-monophosphatase